MSTYYSFYKKCSYFGLALFLAMWVGPMVQTGFAADAGLLDPKAAAGKILDNSGLEEKLHQADIVDPKENLKASHQNKARGHTKAETHANELAASEGEPLELVEEVVEEVVETDPAKRLGIKTKSIDFLVSFDPTGKRDPFSSMQAAPREAMPAGDSWWDDAAEQPAETNQQNKDLYFNGQSPTNSSASFARLPAIKVTGMMQIGGRSAVTAIIQNKGSCVLYENDRLVLNAGQGSNLTKWLFIKKIHANGMTLMLDDGKEISGKFY